jgi:hypothetical protein
MILTDNETKVDLLNNEAIAKTIIELLCSRPNQPVTVGVHGDWGAGKSSVLEMIEAGFADNEKALCLKFNGWRFQGFEDAKIALIEGIVTGLLDKRPNLRVLADGAKDLFRRIDWLKLAKKGGGLAFTAFTGIPAPDLVKDILGSIEAAASDPVKLAGVVEDLEGFLKPKSETANVPMEIAAFRKAFDELLERAGIDQLVVLVDDLDRCLPDTAIETLEAIRLFVFTSRTAFVVAADEAMIEYAVRKHFPDLPDTTGPQGYARNYLEKLIQVPFRIPALGETETRIYVTLLLVGAKLADGDGDFVKLIAEARERLRRPWMTSALDAAAIRKALGDGTSGAGLEALTLSDQIGPILASGTKGNPRQIKRFLNALVLRQSMAAARGFGDNIKLPVLAKLMLAERFLPRLFDQIAAVAAVSSDGKCADLKILEAVANEKGGGDSMAAKKPEAAADGDGGVLSEWLASPAAKAWAVVQPPVGDEDLRPYLFVAKDRKDYFGAASVLGHVAAIAEQLFGGRMAVQALDADLRKLAPPEAAQVFDLVRGRIIGAGEFGNEPSGVPGLVALVRAHPTLQNSLLDFIESLPVARLGVWASRGWDSAITERDCRVRLQGILRRWAESQEASDILKAAISAIARTPTRRQ